MDGLFALFAFALALWLLAGPIIAIVALRRAGRAERDLLRLRRWVSRLGTEQAAEQLQQPEESGVERAVRSIEPPTSETVRPTVAPLTAASKTETPVRPAGTSDATAPSASVPASAPAGEEPRKTRRPIEWERWVGVRGAALLGGILFALAAVFLYQHAVEQGWLTPRSRVFGGTTLGVALIVAAEVLRRKAYAFTPGALGAAGIVALYASSWAAYQLYAMIGQVPALGAFAAITGLCVALALRHNSQTIAVLGLLGGFATPLTLSMPADSPIGLFGYLLLLNAGMLALGKRKTWDSLGMLAVLGTAVIEIFWALTYAEPDEALVGLGALAVLALLFIAMRPALPERATLLTYLTRTGVVFTPLVLGAYFAQRADMQIELWVLASFGVVIHAGSLVLAKRQGDPSLALATSAGLVAVVFARVAGHTVTGTEAVSLCAVSSGLGLLFGVLARVTGSTASRWSSFVVHTALLAMLVGFALPEHRPEHDSPWPWFGAATIGFFALVADKHQGRERCIPTLLGGALAALALYHVAGPTNDLAPVASVSLIAALVFAGTHTVAGMLGAHGHDRSRPYAAAAAIVPLLLLASQWLVTLPAGSYPATMGALALCIAVLATRARSGVLVQSAVVLFAIATSLRWAALDHAAVGPDVESYGMLAAVVVMTCALIAWPAIWRDRFALSSIAWRASASAAPLLAIACVKVTEAQFGRSWKLLVPGGLALALVLTDRFGARRLDGTVRRTARTWLLSMAAPFAAAAIMLPPEQGPWATLWLAITGALLALVARTQRHPGPALVSAACLLLATFGLLFAGSEPLYEKSEYLLWNRMTLDGLGVALCAAFALACFTRQGHAHLAESRPRLQWLARPLVVGVTLALATTLFQWINLTVFDHWTEGAWVRVDFDHLPARDLTLSSSWIVYGLAWLGVGMWKRISAARWLSLGVLLFSLGKVFLFDLAHLEGLYRVASLFGLGLSLVAVSLLYQRFVFPRSADDDAQSA